MKTYKVTPDVREQIINRIKEGSVTVQQAAKEHGVSDAAVYAWLGKKADGIPSILEFAKLKRERDELLRLVGEITLKLSESQKRSDGNGDEHAGESASARHCTVHALLPQKEAGSGLGTEMRHRGSAL